MQTRRNRLCSIFFITARHKKKGIRYRVSFIFVCTFWTKHFWPRTNVSLIMLDMCARGIQVLRQSCRHLEPILTKILVPEQSLVQHSNIKFNENTLSDCPVLSYVGNIWGWMMKTRRIRRKSSSEHPTINIRINLCLCTQRRSDEKTYSSTHS
jgi:hypothetical protein